jgi:O-antigen ligase
VQTASVAARLAENKGSCVAPLFFVSLACALAGSRLGTVLPWALSACALAAAGWAAGARGPVLSPLSLPVFGFAVLVALHTLLLSPAYTPAGLYHPLLLVLGFLAARRSGEQGERSAARSAFAFGVILAAWGLVQVGPLGVARAHALFETPATFAAVINLLLVPLLAAVLLGRRGALPLALLAGFAAAMFAADSRGGLLALAAGFAAASLLGLRARQLRSQGIVLALALLVTGWLLAAALRALPWEGLTTASVEPPPTAQAQAESSQSRLELYALSWNAWRERPLSGTGYLTFRYTLEQGRAQVPSYGESAQTWFVHNDYLQSLQELGPLGLVALLALAWLPAWFAYRRIPALPQAQRAPVIAAASGLAAMACHALFDFPFYIPVCLVLYGALLGVLDRRLGALREAAAATSLAPPWLRAAGPGLVLLAGVLLLRPVAAEAAAAWGMRGFAAGDGQSAALWLGVARRIEPADWRYHWYAGQFWDGQAAVSGRREAARLAAQAYAAGFEANRLEVSNLLGKISVHRRHGKLLEPPADSPTQAAWVAQAEALAPFNDAVRRERALLGAAR